MKKLSAPLWLSLFPSLLLAQPAARLEVAGVPQSLRPGQLFSLTVQAVTAEGQPTTNCPAAVQLSVFAPSPAAPVISEYFRSGSVVEISNPGVEALDLADWELQAYADYPPGVPQDTPNTRLRFPAQTILRPGEVLTWSDRGQAPGAFPGFVSAKPFVGLSHYGLNLLRLVDPRGRIVDELYLRDYSYAPSGALWKGLGLAWSSVTNRSYSRTGLANHFGRPDWVLDTPSPGWTNPALRLPWTHSGSYGTPVPGAIPLTNCVWTGPVQIPVHAPGPAQLRADTGTGISGASGWFTMTAGPALSLTADDRLTAAEEASAGNKGTVTVSIPEPLTNDLRVTLSLNATTEFAVPTNIVIVAGATQAIAQVTILDDDIADGTAIATLTAQATNYSPASIQLLNIDDETNTLNVLVSGPVPEDAGLLDVRGSVWLGEPARHDVLVMLSATPPVEVPPFVIILAGNLSASFPVRVESDEVVNPVPWVAEVRAETAGWPMGVGRIELKDDDDGTFSLLLPAMVLEGTSETGTIVARRPRQVDTLFTLSANHGRLLFPREVILKAGALTAAFPLTTTNNTTAEGHWRTELCAASTGQVPVCTNTDVLDDEVGITRLTLRRPQPAVFSGQSFPLQAILGNQYEQPQYTNATGTLELLTSTNVATFAGDPNPLQFTQGQWSNSITLQGEGLHLQLKAEAAGFQATSAPFDLLTGTQAEITVSEAVYNAATGLLLVIEPAQTNQPARLTELDPRTAQRGRSLNLPRPAQRIALSEDGSVAWLASTKTTLQKVNLATWQFAAEYPVEPGNTNAVAGDLLVLPGGQDRVLAATTTNKQNWEAVLYLDGVPTARTNRALLPGIGQGVLLLQGRTPGEVFCQTYGFLSRLLVGTNSAGLDRFVNAVYSTHATLADGLIYRGAGDVFSAESLERIGSFPVKTDTKAGIACPDLDTAVFVFAYGNIGLEGYDLTTGTSLGMHGLPEAWGDANRLLRWGGRGFAVFRTGGGRILLIESPLLNSGEPDLVLSATGPEVVTLPGYDNGAFYFVWEFSVTNRGAAQAPAVEIRLGSGAAYALGTLAPGEGARMSITNLTGTPELVRFDVSAVSAVRDANPLDNTLSTVTRVQRANQASTRNLVLGMTNLVGAPGGNRLYAAVSRAAGELQDGVAVIDPVAGTVETILPVGSDPRRLAISEDGSQLYVQLGTNSLVRWDLLTRTQNLALTLEQDAILDFAVVPGTSLSFVVASQQRVAVYDDAVVRPQQYQVPQELRSIAFAGPALWLAEPGQLLQFDCGSSGLAPKGVPVPFTLPGRWSRFSSDGRNLFFPGVVYDTLTGQRRNLFLGEYVISDPTGDALFSTVGYNFHGYAPETLELRGTQPIWGAGGWYLEDPVRWGEGGLAARSGAQLVMVDSPIVPSTLAADLAVRVFAPTNATAYEPMVWSVIVTNHSAVPAPRTSLRLDTGGLRDLSIEGPPFILTFSTLSADLGELPAHGSAAFQLKGWVFPTTLTVSAAAATAAADPDPANNQASVSIEVLEPQADLAVASLTMPSQVHEGETFEVTAVFRNNGPELAPNTQLSLSAASGLQLLEVADHAYETNEYGVLFGRLGPGESRTVALRYRALMAGLAPVVVSAGGGVRDHTPSNNGASQWIFTVPANTNQAITEMSCHGPILAWDYSRQQVLAAFPNKSWDLFLLDPWTMEPLSRMPLPGLPQFIATCNNGRHAWVSLAEGMAVRVDLEAMSIDRQFTYDAQGGPVWAIAAPPGQANLLVVAMDPGWLGNSRLRIYDNGVPRAGEYGPFGWTGGGVSLLFNSEGRLFFGVSQTLRELKINPTGFTEVRNLDATASYDGVSLSYAAEKLFYPAGRWVDLNAGTYDDGLFPAHPLVADEQGSLLYTATGSTVLWGGPPMTIRCLDARTVTPVWRAVVDLPASGVGNILPLGTNGCLVVGSSMWLVRPAFFGEQKPELVLSVSNAPDVGELGVAVPIQISLTNRSVWVAPDTAIVAELGPGLAFTETPPGLTGKIDLGHFSGATNLTFSVRPIAAGESTLSLQAVNRLTQPSPERTILDLIVLPPPVFQFDNTTRLEGGYAGWGPMLPLTATLSRPAPTDLSATFTIVPLSAGSNDFSALSGTFLFLAGSSKASVYLVNGNNIPELDKTAMLTFASTNLILARTNALLTLVNDDLPQLSVANVSLEEGNDGWTNATFKLALSTKAPFPVAVHVRTVPGTAGAADFIPCEGRVRFAPNTDMQVFSVPVVGDSLHEPEETASLALLEATDMLLGSSGATLTIKNDDRPPVPWINVVALEGNKLRFQFASVAEATYQLEISGSPAGPVWRNVGSAVQSGGGDAVITITRPGDQAAFYRLRAW